MSEQMTEYREYCMSRQCAKGRYYRRTHKGVRFKTRNGVCVECGAQPEIRKITKHVNLFYPSNPPKKKQEPKSSIALRLIAKIKASFKSFGILSKSKKSHLYNFEEKQKVRRRTRKSRQRNRV